MQYAPKRPKKKQGGAATSASGTDPSFPSPCIPKSTPFPPDDRSCRSVHPLTFDKFGEDATALDELVVAALLGDAAICDHQNSVALAHGRQPVRDDDARALRLVVERTRSLIEHEDATLAAHGAGYHDSLALTARHTAPALRHEGLHAHGHPTDVVGNARKLGGFPSVIKCG